MKKIEEMEERFRLNEQRDQEESKRVGQVESEVARNTSHLQTTNSTIRTFSQRLVSVESSSESQNAEINSLKRRFQEVSPQNGSNLLAQTRNPYF